MNIAADGLAIRGENNETDQLDSAQFWISELQFSDGTSVALGPSDTVILVGPNNAGKSATLRAIWSKLSDSTTSPVLASISVEKGGSEEQMMELLKESSFVAVPESNNPVYNMGSTGLHDSQARDFWKLRENRLGPLRDLFCKILSADVRLDTSKPAPNIDITSQARTHPVHSLIADADLEKQVSDSFRQAFGHELMLNRLAGGVLPLSVGQRPKIPEGGDRLSTEYAQALSKLPKLVDQGDGMRSFAGLLLHLMIGPATILLIDEPEAFLHPPQAKQMGRLLSVNRPKQRQTLVATHSADVLRGALDGGSNVTVVRIQRSGEVNRAKQLDKSKIAELWSDPLLRYSNIFDGLFHERVIVCEADGDARFYAAISDVLIEGKPAQTRQPDVLFTHCGGKQRIPVVVRALQEVDVPTSVIVDFDVLNSADTLRSIVEATGACWADFEADWKIVNSAVTTKKPELSASDAVGEIRAILNGVKGPNFPTADIKRIQKLLKSSSPWATAKQTGKAFIPSGDATQAYNRLSKKLRENSIFLVEVGELEGFAKSVPNKGPRWVNETLKKNLKEDIELEQARQFMAEVLGS